VRRLLDSLDTNTDAKKDTCTHLEVTHMADDKLTILVKVWIKTIIFEYILVSLDFQ